MNKLNRVLIRVLALTCLCGPSLSAQSNVQSSWQLQPMKLPSRWAKEVSPTNALPEYPRPQMVRPQWQNLNGLWQYAITTKEASQPSAFDGQILVPYPIESGLSGVKKTLLPTQRLWYRRNIESPSLKKGERLLLHFGAVDWQTTVYVNGKEVGQHEGGYQSFSFDITDVLKPGRNELNELIVAVWDPTNTGPNPTGKQVLQPGGIMYTPTSGIWQTVWLETVPAISIQSLKLTPDVDAGLLRVAADLSNTTDDADNYIVRVRAKSNGRVVSTVSGKPGAELRLAVANARLWSPTDPFLYDLTVELMRNGKIVDRVESYFGMRKIEVKKDAAGIDRIFLNNRYTYNLGVLDQGFWPDGVYTAPTDAALKFDVEAIKAMGFNTIRKHIKVEPARWYYHCDKLGMLVWQDMPQPQNDSKAADSKAARDQFEKESAVNISQLYNYPSIVVWVLFNEGWGEYDQERLAKWMKQLDPSRLLNGHSGGYITGGFTNKPPRTDANHKWVASDVTDIHAYPNPDIPPALPGKGLVLGEFGGIGTSIEGHLWDDVAGWGYIKKSPAELATTYDGMMKQLKLHEVKGLSGSIYTQPFDVETEENGLMTYDREVIKIPLDKLRKMNEQLIPATTGTSFNLAAFPAKTAAPEYPNLSYEGLLKQYNNGRKEPAFVLGLVRMAHEQRDEVTVARIVGEYIAGMQDLYTKENIEFLTEFSSSKNKGFDLFHLNGKKIDEIMGTPGYSRNVIYGIIWTEEIDSRLWQDSNPITNNPDWNGIRSAITTKYSGVVADKLVLGAKISFYRRIKDWRQYIIAVDERLSRYPPKKGGSSFSNWDEVESLNDYAMGVFRNSNDKDILSKALEWSELSIKLGEGVEVARYLDTKANLLYKLGRVQEAIALEEKAIDLATKTNQPVNDFNKTLSMMKAGEPTWPVK